MTVTDFTPAAAKLRPASPGSLTNRTSEEHTALHALLHAARDAETRAAAGPAQQEAFRTSRSLIAASVVLGFTLPSLASMLGVTIGSVRTRSNVLAPIPRASFDALVTATPTATATATATGQRVDPVELLTWYLATSFVAQGFEASA